MDDDHYGNDLAGYIRAFTIFAKYGLGIGEIRGRDDYIIVYADAAVMTVSDRAELAALGWLQDGQDSPFRKWTG